MALTTKAHLPPPGAGRTPPELEACVRTPNAAWAHVRMPFCLAHMGPHNTAYDTRCEASIRTWDVLSLKPSQVTANTAKIPRH